MESLMPAKRILAAALALLLAVSFAAPSGAQALSADGFEYTVTRSVATVTGCTSTCPTNLVIPATLGGYSVASIGSYAFYASGLTSLTLPNTLVSIAEFAFEANPLTTVSIPDSVETIGMGAFFRNSLTVLQLGNQVISIGEAAFADLGPNENSISSLIIPDSVASIGSSAFSGNALTSVTFFGDAPTDGVGVFSGNSDLSFVTRSSTATGWGEFWSGVPVVTDGLPPETTLNLTPNSTTSSLVASFGFSGTDNYASVTFQCSVDGGIYGACTSPFNTSTLSLGPHMFAVRAVDAVGNIDPTPAIYSWTIESGLPPTDREGSGWSTTLVILAGLTAAASIGLRVRGSKRA
jgi:hypothetical protein